MVDIKNPIFELESTNLTVKYLVDQLKEIEEDCISFGEILPTTEAKGGAIKLAVDLNNFKYQDTKTSIVIGRDNDGGLEVIVHCFSTHRRLVYKISNKAEIFDGLSIDENAKLRRIGDFCIEAIHKLMSWVQE